MSIEGRTSMRYFLCGVLLVLCPLFGCETPYSGHLGPKDFNGWIESEENGLVCLWNGFDRLCIVEKFKVIEVEKVVEVPFEVEKVFVERLFYLVVLAPNTVTETPLGEIVTDAENEIIDAPADVIISDLTFYGEPEPQPQPELPLITEAEAEAEPEPEPKYPPPPPPPPSGGGIRQPEPEAQPEPQPQPEAETEPKAEIEYPPPPPQPEPERETQPQPEAEADPEPEVQPQPEAEADPEPEVQPQPELPLITEPEPEAESEPEPQREPVPRSEPKNWVAYLAYYGENGGGWQVGFIHKDYLVIDGNTFTWTGDDGKADPGDTSREVEAYRYLTDAQYENENYYMSVVNELFSLVIDTD